MSIPAELTKKTPELFLQHLLKSYTKSFGHTLVSIDPHRQLFDQLFHAPGVILSHGIQPDPIFNFGNQTALDLWELCWEQLITMPSRLSAETDEQDERQRLLDDVHRQNWSDRYRGVRISSTGQRFEIQKVKIWNVLDEQQTLLGQAAHFKNWKNI